MITTSVLLNSVLALLLAFQANVNIDQGTRDQALKVANQALTVAAMEISSVSKTSDSVQVSTKELNNLEDSEVKVTVNSKDGKAVVEVPLPQPIITPPSVDLKICGGNGVCTDQTLYTNPGQVTLKWTSTGEILSCVGSTEKPTSFDFWSGPKKAEGSQNTWAINFSALEITYIINCTDKYGETVKDAVKVNFGPKPVHTVSLEYVSSSATLKTNSDATPDDDEGVFIMTFEVTAPNADIYVNQKVSMGISSANSSVNYYFTDDSGTIATASISNTTGVLSSSADLVQESALSYLDRPAKRYVVRQGEVETFTLTTTIDPIVSGFYRLQLHGFNYNGQNSNPNTQQLMLPASDFRSSTLSI